MGRERYITYLYINSPGMQRLFNPLADSGPIFWWKIAMPDLKRVELCPELIYLAFYPLKVFKSTVIKSHSTITFLVSKIPATVLRHALTSHKQQIRTE